MKKENRFKAAVIVGLSILSATQAFADESDTIVQTVNNPSAPAGKQIDIKNIDLHRVDYAPENGGATITSYGFDIYLLVEQDLGYETNAIAVVDVNDLNLKPVDQPAAHIVGKDSTTGYSVYEVRMNATPGQTYPFYASVNLSGATYYSNEGNPGQYFVFSAQN
jgi:hypothetical protein